LVDEEVGASDIGGRFDLRQVRELADYEDLGIEIGDAGARELDVQAAQNALLRIGAGHDTGRADLRPCIDTQRRRGRALGDTV